MRLRLRCIEQKAIEMACKLSKPGDTVILLSVLPVVL